MSYTFLQGDSIDLPFDDKSVDLVFCSPPYEAARTYGIDFKLRGEDWVKWAVERFKEHLRVCRGLVAWVVEGQTRNYQWSATPAMFMADLHRAGVKLRKPPAFHRVGIPGSGGPDWLRNDYEFIVCATHGKLPWSNNTAMGHPPRWAPGGEMSNRMANGDRANRNQWGGTKKNGKHRKSSGEGVEAFERPSHVYGTNQWRHSIDSGATVVDESGVVRSKGKRPSHFTAEEKTALGGKIHTKRDASEQTNGDALREQVYLPPVLANPGNCIKTTYTSDEVATLLSEASDTIHRNVGGGVMGDKICHENEAPFPESLAEFFIRSFCPPDGVVLDPFSGSGTTVATAVRWGRCGIGMDIRESQVALGNKRLGAIKYGDSLAA